MLFTPKQAARIGKDLALSTKVLVDTTLALDGRVCADMERLQPDVIVADSMATWGKAVALKLGIPFVSSTTTFAFNRYSAQIMKQSLGDLFRMLVSMPKAQKQIKRLQEKGYLVKSVLDIIQNDDNTNTVVYTSPEFQPCADTFSNKYAFVGPCIREAAGEFAKTRNTLLYISMGTVNNDMLAFYRECIKAFGNKDYQVLMSVGNVVDVADFGTLPPNITVTSFADQMAVLGQADVFVSHCGMNSASESLYFGVPIMARPQTSEQGGVARRVCQLGAGLPLAKGNAAALVSAVDTVLSDATYTKNAQKIGEGFRRCSGAKGAADKILEACGG